ncbi:acyl-CoA dehydrogenase [Corallococcus praedator]|uniref:Acyl-CoA dehydrogenase n=1 Tax=Corallococcus praedator TaxID=2316724 RepID=A0ABX9QPE3_9BACT|nr:MULTISPECIES: acyl-CoA dehydrogenase family protein [Corallococcus]RKH33966.1 acyl-CoA dehydrogenase [Corallococcus sp. CA031C]RKI14329.1 acyl-CoA dehydrogenase [Corallococcus praedator]
MTQAFREQVRAFVNDHVRPDVDAWEREGAYPLELYRQAGRAGLLALGKSPEQLPDDPRALAVLVEELTLGGAQGITMGLASHFVSLKAVQGSDAQVAARVVPAVLKGDQGIVLALTEPQAGSDLRAFECRAESRGGEYRLTGEKSFICNGGRADLLLVGAVHEGALALFLVEAKAPGVSSTRLACLGWRCLPLASLRFEAAPARLLIAGREAGRLLQTCLQQERLNLAVMAVASAELALRDTVAHCRTRRVGGEALLDKSVLRQRLAERHSELSVVRVYVEQAVRWQAEGQLSPAQAAIAKNSAVDVLERIAHDAVQLHGAHGCVEPARVERIYRDARLLGIGGGAREVMLEVIGRAL